MQSKPPSSLPPGLEGYRKSQEEPGAYICDRETFLYIYDLERRRAERDWHNIYLSRLVLQKSKENGIDLDLAAEKMLETIRRRVRRGDAVCRWQEEDFLLMLYDLEGEDVKRVVERIKEYYFQNIKRDDLLKLDWDYSPVLE